jgi:hypothetical protein
MDIGRSAFDKLLRFRIALFGAGDIKTTITQEGYPYTFVTLPDGNRLIRVWNNAEGAEIAQLHSILGKPLCQALDIRSPRAFMMFMHTVDCGFVANRLNAPISNLVERADLLFSQGQDPSIGMEDVSLGNWNKSWKSSTPEAHAIMQDGEVLRRPIDLDMNDFAPTSLRRWQSQIADWILGPEKATGIEGTIWRKLNAIEANAAALRLDHDNIDLPLNGVATAEYWILESSKDGTTLLLIALPQGITSTMDSHRLQGGIYTQKHVDTVTAIHTYAEDITMLFQELDLHHSIFDSPGS